MKLAIIDLGTNTCNLLIAAIEEKGYSLLYQGKEGVKLGKGGINRNRLTEEAFYRAEAALKKHLQVINRYGAGEVRTLATSAVRDAENRQDFAAYIKERTGLELIIVSGEEEADFIYKGVLLAFGRLPGLSLILDIGGGSNEFILIENNAVIWKKSFPLGMARVIDKFTISDPVRPEEAAAVESWFEDELPELWEQLKGKKPERLIGCAGAFDTLADLLEKTPPATKYRTRCDISLHDFSRISEEVIYSTRAEREKMTGMDQLRIEMIVPAFLFIRLVVSRLHINLISQTGYSLREGVLFEQINC